MAKILKPSCSGLVLGAPMEINGGEEMEGHVGCGEWRWWCWFRWPFKTTSQGRGLGAKNLKTKHASLVLSMLYPTTIKGNKGR